ncbi:L,D-transpeptidase family protein [Azotobacter salinestris]|uniref:L,D-transpeptidase family protein n=1 Tax=Azotobacter salinestris TaxID=69964 RepID=UPI001AD71061|nr:L,D-transpeptidase family protein [Azotobacter salinestris]
MYKKCTALLTTLLLAAQLAQAAPDTPGIPLPGDEALHQQLAQPSLGCVSPAVELDAFALEALSAFYRQLGYQRVWAVDARLEKLLGQLAQLVDDGLEPANYQLASLRRLAGSPASHPKSSACTDVLATHAYLQALRHLAYGQLDQARVEPLWRSPNSRAPASPTLFPAVAVTQLDDLPAAFAAARPDFEPYRALRHAYAELRRNPSRSWRRVPEGDLLRPGMTDERVPLLEQRLTAEGYLTEPARPGSDRQRYTPQLVEAVKRFQARHFLDDDGVVGPATLAELNVTPAERQEQVRANLERFRWLAREMEPTLLLVDVAGAQLTLFRDQQPRWQTRTQVGRPARPTPLLKSQVTHLTLNPTWTIPPTILREDKLPQIQRNIGFLASQNLKVIDYQGNEVNPHSVDWHNPSGIMLRQDPGPHNPLGRIAIRFPNPFAVYLHDTPSQHLFAKETRTLSSGCVRVERAMQLTDLLLEGANPAERQRFEEILASGKTRNLNLPRPVPILLAYWTAQVDDGGQLTFRPDIYGYDAKIIAALKAPALGGEHPPAG